VEISLRSNAHLVKICQSISDQGMTGVPRCDLSETSSQPTPELRVCEGLNALRMLFGSPKAFRVPSRTVGDDDCSANHWSSKDPLSQGFGSVQLESTRVEGASAVMKSGSLLGLQFNAKAPSRFATEGLRGLVHFKTSP
jgi:hypothetical protein